MSVTPTQVPVSTSVPALTLAAGTTGGVAVASSIDPVNDYTLIYTNSAAATQGINRNTYLGISSQPVGLTDSQTLTNKTLTSPTINGATLSGTLSGTYTIGGTPTFPSNVVTLTGSQTLTNKILTSPTINNPTITNATYSGDAIVGYTTSNAGTIYGISVSGGQITNAAIANGTIGSTQIATNGVSASNLSTTAISIGSVTSSTTQSGIGSTPLLVSGLTTTVTIPTGGRTVRIEASVQKTSNSSACGILLGLYNSTTVTGSPIQTSYTLMADGGSNGTQANLVYEYIPSSGSQSYCISISVDAGSGGTGPTATSVNYLRIKVV